MDKSVSPESVAGAPAVPVAAAGGAAAVSLKSLTLRGVAWTLAGDGGAQILRLVSNLILSRLLMPETFGLMVVVFVVQQGLTMFSDVGIHPAIVQHARGDDSVFLNTAWTTQVLRGVFLWLATWALAWPVSQYCNEPMLTVLLPIVGITSLIDGFLSTKVFTSDRHLSLGRLTILNLGTALLGLIIRIGWAWRSPTVWALVGGGIVASIARVILSHGLIPGAVNRFTWDRQSLRELMQFGRWVFLSTLLTFIALQLDKIVFVRMIPLAMLGVYNHGSSFCRVPVETVQRIGTQVVFPALCRIRDRQGNLESAYMKLRVPLLVAGGGILAFLTLSAPTLIQILYPSRYHDAGWIMQLVALGLWFQVIQSTNQTVLLAFARPKILALGNLVKIIAMAGALPAGFRWWGFPGALVAMAVVEIPKYLFEASRVRGHGLKGWTQELGLTAAVMACAAVALVLHLWTPSGGTLWTKVALAAIAWSVVWVPLAVWARRTTLLALAGSAA
jgi:O-antigen/teichoic acid export membrane protein